MNIILYLWDSFGEEIITYVMTLILIPAIFKHKLLLVFALGPESINQHIFELKLFVFNSVNSQGLLTLFNKLYKF